MLLKLRNALRGSVRVEVRGPAPERFLNLCAARGTAFWDVCRTEEECLTASVTVPGYFLLCRSARSGPCRVRAVAKRGLPFTARKLTRRRALLVCVILCAAAVWYLSGFIWTIGISGCETVPERQVLLLLRQAGLFTGARSDGIRSRNVRDFLLTSDERLAYVTVNVTGCHADVVVTERRDTPEPEDETPCNVVSDKAGIVLRLRVMAGKALTKVGETLLPGDIIATGAMESSQGERWNVAARAEVDLLTWRTAEAKVTSAAVEKSYTGRVQIRRYLLLGTRRFPLEIVEKEPFRWYDKQIEQKNMPLRTDFRFSVALITETLREYVPVSASPEAADLQDVLKERMERQLTLTLKSGEIRKTTFTLTFDGCWTGRLESECVETAGILSPLP
ncbi:MAG: sporulation protein YqfD [Clostridiaceae bacterium]|nr:sporulation protein YqfD [Clostridiaceae bacterium]